MDNHGWDRQGRVKVTSARTSPPMANHACVGVGPGAGVCCAVRLLLGRGVLGEDPAEELERVEEGQASVYRDLKTP